MPTVALPGVRLPPPAESLGTRLGHILHLPSAAAQAIITPLCFYSYIWFLA